MKPQPLGPIDQDFEDEIDPEEDFDADWHLDQQRQRQQRQQRRQRQRQRQRQTSRSTTSKPTSRYYTNEGIIERFAPKWARKAAKTISQLQSPGWRLIALFFGIGLFIVSLLILIGGGYTSIQGIRIPLHHMGFNVTTEGLPVIQWWLWPIGLGFTEITIKHIEGIRFFSFSAYVFDGATTGLFMSTWFTNLLTSIGKEASIYTLGIISSLAGFGIAIFVEQLFLASILILLTAAKKPQY